jgi:hypothetical protein
VGLHRAGAALRAAGVRALLPLPGPRRRRRRGPGDLRARLHPPRELRRRRPLLPWLFTSPGACASITSGRAGTRRLLRSTLSPTCTTRPSRPTSRRARSWRGWRGALQGLPEGPREALALFHLHDLSYKGDCGATRGSTWTVMTWIHRGRDASGPPCPPRTSPQPGGAWNERPHRREAPPGAGPGRAPLDSARAEHLAGCPACAAVPAADARMWAQLRQLQRRAACPVRRRGPAPLPHARASATARVRSSSAAWWSPALVVLLCLWALRLVPGAWSRWRCRCRAGRPGGAGNSWSRRWPPPSPWWWCRGLAAGRGGGDAAPADRGHREINPGRPSYRRHEKRDHRLPAVPRPPWPPRSLAEPPARVTRRSRCRRASARPARWSAASPTRPAGR